MAELLKGAPVAAAISEDLKNRCEILKNKGITPCAAIVRVGERPDDLAYERAALKRLDSIGIAVKQSLLPTECAKEDLLAVIDEINADNGIHGCLMFRPLSDRQTEKEAAERLLPKKDIDCMTAGSLSTVFTGSGIGFPPCTAQAVIEMCDYYGIKLEGKEVAVIGRSLVIGRPVSMLLQQRNATVTMCHTRTADLPKVCRRADIIVAAAGHAGLVGAEHVLPDQIVIDVGVNVTPDGILTGDVDFDAVEPIVSSISPVPGGVGSITTAVLAKHTIIAAELNS
ncbi:MAG: bifunctional 5,10-methylene-tetrahydrofolate dehydrogenase/5,10-methylene-tetrahydrofolate cyclohydrolase [Lachnospiraceae bacterium]|nr:bifunctional 5,10-methylene-tetrahydrofolate dehydrogenase/5,10-methylene-tetrahydrofolate cyclohydrolase [Lachnospiraceae bacterium]